MKQRGVTLIELIAAITVIGLAGAALMGTLSYLSGTSSSLTRQAQAQAIADAYLAEISGMSFVDPDGAGEGANRALWDNVADYNGLNTAVASDKQGNVIGNFPVQVTVTQGALPPVPNNAVWRIDVQVSYDVNAAVLATGYRTNHP